jgi:ElaB/YqjD/DUF883 family membrane-anchored ribosome-binding protein
MGLFSNDPDPEQIKALVQELANATAALAAERAKLDAVHAEIERAREQAAALVDHWKEQIETAGRQASAQANEAVAQTKAQALHGLEQRAHHLHDAISKSLESKGAIVEQGLHKVQEHAIESVGHAQSHGVEQLQTAAGQLLSHLHDRGEQMAHSIQATLGSATEQAVHNIMHARDQVSHMLENTAHQLHRTLDDHGGTWVERVLHSANSVLGKIPVVGVISETAEGVVHEINKK